MKLAAFALSLLSVSGAALAGDAPDFTGQSDCKVARLASDPGATLAWDGACKDGFASGTGVLQRSRVRNGIFRYEVTMVRGQISEVGDATYKNGDKYHGFFRDGKPDGKGYMQYANGDQYEGDFEDGLRDGNGTFVEVDRSRYVGHWKAGERDGAGAATFALGGSYEGAWKADKFEGKGVIVYAGSGHLKEALFADGREVGSPAPVKPEVGRYAMKRADAKTGSRIKQDAAIDFVPSDKPYAALTPQQQAVINGEHAALEPGDEPPYPLHGTKPIIEWMAKGEAAFRVAGELRLYVLVGKDGHAVSVTAIGSPSPEITNFASLVMAKETYKPAICRGVPCEMIYPMRFSFVIE